MHTSITEFHHSETQKISWFRYNLAQWKSVFSIVLIYRKRLSMRRH
jgi:hypothetical protein